MKQYLVTEAELVKALWAPGEMLGKEIKPGARIFTEEQVKAVFNKHGVNGYRHPIRDAILKDLFGEVKDDHK